MDREIELNADLIIFVQPTRGLDIGAIENIRKKIIAERDAGKAILLISLELDEIMNCADTIAVIYGGVIQNVAPADSLDEKKVGEYMILPTYEVSDNYTSSENIHKIVSVVDPSGKTYYLDNTTEANRDVDLNGKPIPPVNAFKAMQVGKHTVTIMVVDGAGNITSFTYDVNVKEAK